MKSPVVHLSIAVVISVLALAGYLGWYTVISRESASVAALEDKITTANASATRMAALRSALAGLSNDEAQMRSYFVAETEVVPFISRLEASGQGGATVNVLSVSSGTSKGYPTLLFAVSVEGTFEAVMRTVGAIEYLPYNLTISALSVGKGTKGVWSANMNLIVGTVADARNTHTP